MRAGFGLDLAGFSNQRGTVLAVILAEESKATVTLLSGSPFNRRLDDSNFADRLKNETVTLKKLIEIGPIAVDVPIDLQELPFQLQALSARDITQPWQLTKRAVDDRFDGLAPLASWLGACVARFAAIMPSELRQKELGVRIFETYPAANLQRLVGENDPDVNQYKLADKKKAKIAAGARLGLCKRLKIDCKGQPLNHDELDAIICALAAVATPQHLLTEAEHNLRNSETLPTGYRILNKTRQFESIKVCRRPFDEWVLENSRYL